MAKNGSEKVAASVCLYGAPHCGYGYLAYGPSSLAGGKEVTGGRLYGSGEPGEVSSCNSAYWLGMKALKEAGLPSSTEVSVFMPGGEKVAKVTLGGMWPCFGELKWEAAPVWVISGAELEAAASSPPMPFEKPEA